MNWVKLREHFLADVRNEVAPPRLAIPPLPAVTVEFCRAAERPDITINELGAILERDAVLLVEVLRMVNSSALAVRNKISSARAALSLLGIRRARMYVLTTSVQSVAQRVKSPLCDLNLFSFAAMQRAVFSRRFAERRGLDAELAFAAGLLQDFAVPALTMENPDRYHTLIASLSNDAASMADVERARFGWDHALAAARLMLSWQFPDDLICLAFAHHRLEAILASSALSDSELLPVALSSLLPNPLDARQCCVDRLEQLLSTRFKVDVAAFRGWVAEDLQHTGVPYNEDLAWRPKKPMSGLRHAAAARR